MTLPIVEQIAADVVTTIEELCTDNDYDIDLDVVRPKLNNFDDVVPAEGIVLLVQQGTKFDQPAAQTVTAVATFVAAIFVTPYHETTALDTRINTRVADVIKKLLEDSGRATLAIDTTITSVDMFHTPEGFSGADIEFEIKYRTENDDPYTKI